MVMYGLTLWSTALPYVEGSSPELERFIPFFDWYSHDPDPAMIAMGKRFPKKRASVGDTSLIPSGGKRCRDNFLSRELIAAFNDSAVLRQLEADGFRVAPTDWQREPFPEKPFPRPGPATDRWFQYRAWYQSPSRAAMRRLFLETKFSAAMGYLQNWTWGQWLDIHTKSSQSNPDYAPRKVPELAMLTNLQEKPVTEIVTFPFRQELWDAALPVNHRQSDLVRRGSRRSQLDIFFLVGPDIAAMRKLGAKALSVARGLLGEDMWDRSYDTPMFPDDDVARETDEDLIARLLGLQLNSGTLGCAVLARCCVQWLPSSDCAMVDAIIVVLPQA